jgi:hypothetical protein
VMSEPLFIEWARVILKHESPNSGAQGPQPARLVQLHPSQLNKFLQYPTGARKGGET